MAAFERQKVRQRRVDPRKIKGESLTARLGKAAEPRNLVRLAVLALFFLTTMLLMHLPTEPVRYHQGERVEQNIPARVDFSYVDTQATAQKRKQVGLETPNVYVRDTSQTERLRREFAALVEAVAPGVPEPADQAPGEQAESVETVPAEQPENQAAEGETPPAEDAEATDAEAAAEAEARTAERRKVIEAWQLGRDLEEFRRLATDPERAESLAERFSQVLEAVEQMPVLPQSRHSDELTDAGRDRIAISADGDSRTANDSELISANNTRRFERLVEARFREAFGGSGLSRDLREKLIDRVVETLTPNLVYDAELTERRIEQARQEVEPVERQYRRGEALVPAGTTIGPTELERLRAENNAYLAQVTIGRRIASVAGSVILLGLLVYLLYRATELYQANVIDRAVRAFVLAVLFLAVIGVAKLFYAQFERSMVLFPMTTAAMIVTVAYNRRYSLALSWLMILLVTLVARLDFDVALLLVLGTSVAILQLDEVRSRSKLVRAGLVTGVVYFVAVWGLAAWHREIDANWESVSLVLERSSLALVSGLLPGFIVLGVLPIIERVFGVVANIRLLELCDANQPALRKLAIEAPGTYSHSLFLGSLVEPAAEAVGANGLMARVGAYFHDIGKANKPHYFVENRTQLGDAPDHDRLTPQMSKLIIAGHIKDGLDMARQYDLPRAVQRFIAEHHGTTLIEYFYHEARKAGGEPDESDFRYPGPKPQSKETAIVMLADSCESAVRAIKDPTAPKIEDRVHDIVMRRLLDGQLDESGLTLNEVRTIEQNLTKSLISVYHGRIPYPDEAQEPSKPSARQPEGGNADPQPAAGKESADTHDAH